MTTIEVVAKIKARWQSSGIHYNPGLLNDQILDFERRHRVRLPSAMRLFLESMDGTVDGQLEMGEALMNFWPLNKILPVPVSLAHCGGSPDYRGIDVVLPDAANYFVVADHSISVCTYAVKLTDDKTNVGPTIIIHDGRTWRLQWDSYAKFLATYADDPWNLL